jgi:hypothetical protein
VLRLLPACTVATEVDAEARMHILCNTRRRRNTADASTASRQLAACRHPMQKVLWLAVQPSKELKLEKCHTLWSGQRAQARRVYRCSVMMSAACLRCGMSIFGPLCGQVQCTSRCRPTVKTHLDAATSDRLGQAGVL